MPKRKSKEIIESSESGSESEPEPPVKKTTATKATKKAEKPKSKHTEGKSAGANAKSASTEQSVDLGKKRRVTVSLFRSNVMVDIREFYGDEADLKPGKKGISLTVEQWEALKNNVEAIDKLVEDIKK